MKLKPLLSLTAAISVALSVGAQNTPAPVTAAPPAPEAPAPTAPPPAITPTPPAAPETPATSVAPAPEKKSEAATKTKKKKTAKTAATKPATAKKSNGVAPVKFDPPVAATAKQEAVNVRGRVGYIGEVITHLKKGETVLVLEEITLSKPKKDEPAKWNKILMPTNTPVWVSAEFVDTTNKVALKRIHVRGGPGENFSSLAILEKGTPVKDLRKQNDWLEIETPTNAAGFVAAEFLEKQAAPVAVVTPTPAPAPETVTVPAETNAAVAATVEPPAPAPVVAEPAVTNAAPAVAPAPEPAKEETPPPRIVTREGVVKKARNIQAPADFELHDARTGELIDYLQSAKPEMNLKPYVGTKVLVTGPEVLDSRWPRTPIVQIETIALP